MWNGFIWFIIGTSDYSCVHRNKTSGSIILSRVGLTDRRDLEWMIGFIDTLYTPLGTTGNYSAIADLNTLQFTVTHALGFSIFTNRILATDYNTVIIPVSL
jgi:hypothetical protein